MAEYRRRIPGLNSEQVMHAMGIDDAYRVERVLVRNGNGVTELVTIEDAGPFVRKKMPLDRANRAVWAALAGAACPRLPQVAATYEMPDWFVAVYDFVPGETLEDAVARAGALDAQTAVQIARDVCEALSALHQRGVVHLDVSPANVLLAADGAHLLDFGNARIIAATGDATAADALHAASSRRSRPTGTWGFAAPEQYFYKADERSDVFATGRLLGYMLTGVEPDDGCISEFEAALGDKDRAPAPLRAVVERATHFEPSSRYQSVDELLLALDHAARGDVPDTKSNQGAPAATDLASGADASAAGTPAADIPAADTPAMPGGPALQGVRGARMGATRVALVVLACATAIMSLVVCVKVLAGKADMGQQGQIQQQTDQAQGALQGDGHATLPFGEASASDVERAQHSLEIAESGWRVDGGGYVDYAVTLKNTSADLVIEYPEVIVTGRAEDGSVVFSSSQVMGVVYPGYNLTFASLAGDGTAPATVEFSLAKPVDYQVSVGAGRPTEYKVYNLAVRDGADGELTVSGELEKTVEGDEWPAPNDVWLSVILRDEQGQIVDGWNEFVNSPNLGERMPFSVKAYNCPDYATVEVVPLAH